jgi:aquaporin related protein
VRFVLYSIAQFLGAMAASGLVHGLLPGSLDVDTYLSADTSHVRGVFIEMFITAALALTVLCLAAEKHRTTPLSRGDNFVGSNTGNFAGANAGGYDRGIMHHGSNRGSNHGISSSNSVPVAVGMTMFACHLFAYLYTGASMNVARAFGPGVVNRFSRDYHGHHWIYWVGPLLGSLLAAALYTIMKIGRYWKLTPDHSVGDRSDSPPGAMNGMNNMVTGGNPNAADGTTVRDTHHGTLNNNNGVGGGLGADAYNRLAVV